MTIILGHLNVTKVWGYYRVLYEAPGVKVKLLVVEPGHGMSLQRHQHRAEYWQVLSGQGDVQCDFVRRLGPTDEVLIPCGTWHRVRNHGHEPFVILEVQRGKWCTEEDIERREESY